jgi:GntR family transcriptional regulator
MNLPIKVSPDSAEPLYHQIKVQLRSLIINGYLPEGTLLPSIREFAQATACSVITIRRVYQDLEHEGLLRTKQGTGTFVAGIQAEAVDQYQKEAVSSALKQAIEAALHARFTEEQLRELFEEVLNNQLARHNNPGSQEGTHP